MRPKYTGKLLWDVEHGPPEITHPTLTHLWLRIVFSPRKTLALVPKLVSECRRYKHPISVAKGKGAPPAPCETLLKRQKPRADRYPHDAIRGMAARILSTRHRLIPTALTRRLSLRYALPESVCLFSGSSQFSCQLRLFVERTRDPIPLLARDIRCHWLATCHWCRWCH